MGDRSEVDPSIYTTMSINELIENGLTNIYMNKESLDFISSKEMPQLIIECFSNFIRHNINLQCINLDATGLCSKVLAGFVPALRHAKSLLCFHLAQNPGANSQVKEYYRERLRISDKEEPLVIDIKQERDDLEKPLTGA